MTSYYEPPFLDGGITRLKFGIICGEGVGGGAKTRNGGIDLQLGIIKIKLNALDNLQKRL